MLEISKNNLAIATAIEKGYLIKPTKLIAMQNLCPPYPALGHVLYFCYKGSDRSE